MTNILFITKARPVEEFDPSTDSYSTVNYNSGVYLSASFLVDVLDKLPGVNAKLSNAIDNNCIDRLVTEFNADIVIIEAFWVVPEKFDELKPLHPNVKWIIRNHSAMSFIAVDSVILDWTSEYIKRENVFVACNHKQTQEEIKSIVFRPESILYLPNYYPVEYMDCSKRPQYQEDGYVNIACFGAARQLKNQLPQAVASIQYANSVGRKLKFHINKGGESGDQNPILKSLYHLFKHSPNAELIEHPWMDHEDFLEVCSKMDLSLQVSFTETFNIVTADMISKCVPVVTSPEIDWIPTVCYADPTRNNSILFAIKRVMFLDKFLPVLKMARRNLIKFSKNSLRTWNKELTKITKR